MNIINKIKWIVGLLMIFVLVLATNLFDRRNFKKIRQDIEAIYQDRLIAKGLVYELSDIIHRKEMAWVTVDSVFFRKKNPKVNATFDQLLQQFVSTKLTPNERTVFTKLSRDVEELHKYEASLNQVPFSINSGFSQTIEAIKNKLRSLADIQMKEGERIFNNSEGTLNSMKFYTQIELYFLILLAVAIQVIIMIKPKD